MSQRQAEQKAPRQNEADWQRLRGSSQSETKTEKRRSTAHGGHLAAYTRTEQEVRTGAQHSHLSASLIVIHQALTFLSTSSDKLPIYVLPALSLNDVVRNTCTRSPQPYTLLGLLHCAYRHQHRTRGPCVTSLDHQAEVTQHVPLQSPKAGTQHAQNQL